MKVGDLVYEAATGRHGFVERVDKDHFGARQAFKLYGGIGRGQCIRPGMENGIGPTKDGIRDRVLVLWTDSDCVGGLEYLESHEIEVISESR